MVTHDGKRQDFDAKLPGQELQTLLNPGFAVIEVLARDRTVAAEEGPPYRALDAVLNADFRFLNQVASRQAGHGRFSTSVLGEVAEVSPMLRYRTRKVTGGPFCLAFCGAPSTTLMRNFKTCASGLCAAAASISQHYDQGRNASLCTCAWSHHRR